MVILLKYHFPCNECELKVIYLHCFVGEASVSFPNQLVVSVFIEDRVERRSAFLIFPQLSRSCNGVFNFLNRVCHVYVLVTSCTVWHLRFRKILKPRELKTRDIFLLVLVHICARKKRIQKTITNLCKCLHFTEHSFDAEPKLREKVKPVRF